MICLHSLWKEGRCYVWGERLSDNTRQRKSQTPIHFADDSRKMRPRKHPFALDSPFLFEIVERVLGGSNDADQQSERYEVTSLTLALPTTLHGPQGSPRIALLQDSAQDTTTSSHANSHANNPRIYPWRVPAISLDARDATRFVLSHNSLELEAFEISCGDSIVFYERLVMFALGCIAHGRMLPSLELRNKFYEAKWKPFFTSDEMTTLEQLAKAMPALCRSEWSATKAAAKGSSDISREIIRDCVETIVDANTRVLCPVKKKRRGKKTQPMQSMNYAIDAWLRALATDERSQIDHDAQQSAQQRNNFEALAGVIDEWRLSAQSASNEIRTCFRLIPPTDIELSDDTNAPWYLETLLQSIRDPSVLCDAKRVWHEEGLENVLHTESDLSVVEVFLRDLGRATRLFPAGERLLETAQPDVLEISTAEAADFLQNIAPLLDRAGFGVFLPSWWGTKRARLSAKLRTRQKKQTKSTGRVSARMFGLDSLVAYNWQVALGDKVLSERELMRLAALQQPLVQIRGEWVYLNATDLAAALEIAKGSRKRASEEMTAADALRIGLGLENSGIGLTVSDIDADGWLGELLSGKDLHAKEMKNPTDFVGQLRPYQLRGLGWLHFHQSLGLGACLADDMGLGKTAQLLALLTTETPDKTPDKTPEKTPEKTLHTTLVICPMSLVGNWQREVERFAPKLRVHVHHGADRPAGKAFTTACDEADIVLTTYQLALRDQKLLTTRQWHRVVLDEAQNIKNAEASQTRAVQSLRAAHRIALTGTPVENRLSELWSIMQFLNPGLLGKATTFRKQFVLPIEQERDEDAATTLRAITSPFILRRLKTDKSVISDLPKKLEIKSYCNLTREQASLYQATVDDMMARIETTMGIERRGLVLATMLKLKQICNHPAQFLSDGSRVEGRSGKLLRLEEIVEEVRSDQERMLIFTQFAEMGTLLQRHLAQKFGEEVAWLHGGVGKSKRDAMVNAFQANEGPSIFILSLKAGGTGLTLTAANHVVHFDRWWNPAVEDQATDRAFRIGQHRNVQVRKFVVVGTLEESIDVMIEQKKALADRIVGASENWITELSTSALRDVLTLRADAIGE